MRATMSQKLMQAFTRELARPVVFAKARVDADQLRGKIKEGAPGASGHSARIDARTALARRVGARPSDGPSSSLAADNRQRATVKIHYFNHGAGAGRALVAHARYLDREQGAQVPE